MGGVIAVVLESGGVRSEEGRASAWGFAVAGVVVAGVSWAFVAGLGMLCLPLAFPGVVRGDEASASSVAGTAVAVPWVA